MILICEEKPTLSGRLFTLSLLFFLLGMVMLFKPTLVVDIAVLKKETNKSPVVLLRVSAHDDGTSDENDPEKQKDTKEGLGLESAFFNIGVGLFERYIDVPPLIP